VEKKGEHGHDLASALDLFQCSGRKENMFKSKRMIWRRKKKGKGVKKQRLRLLTGGRKRGI